MITEQELLDEVQRLRTVDGFREGVQLIEMESRFLRRRRLPYSDSLRKAAIDKADAIVSAEDCGHKMALMPDEIARLINLLADEFMQECRDG